MKKHVGKYTENGIGALVSGQGIAHGNNEANAMRGAAVRAVCYAGFAALMAGAYVVVGITTGIWHPTWAIFLGGACAPRRRTENFSRKSVTFSVPARYINVSKGGGRVSAPRNMWK